MRTALSPLLLSLLLAVPAVAAPEPDYEALIRGVQDRVVLVRYVLGQKGEEFGGFSQRMKMRSCGVMVRPDGLVLLGGEIFPEGGSEFDEPPWPAEFVVETSDGKTWKASLAGRDEERNLAFLRIEAPGQSFPALAFSEAGRLPLGTPLVVVGLLPEKYGFQRAFVEARVNAITGRAGERSGTAWMLDTALQDLFIGGPVLSRDGRVLGIVALDRVETSEIPREEPVSNLLALLGSVQEGKQFGYPVVLPHAEIAGLIASPPPVRAPGDEQRAWLGVTLQAVSRELADYWSLPTGGGVLVTSVIHGSPAQQAGIRVGDVVVTYDGKPARAETEAEVAPFIRRVRRTEIGREVPVEVLRKGKSRKLAVTVGEAPKTALRAEEHKDPDFGVLVREFTFDVAQALNVDASTRGVFVQEVEPSGWCEVAGIQRGDLVLRVEAAETPSVEAFRDALARAKAEKKREVVFFVQRGQETSFVPVRTDF